MSKGKGWKTPSKQITRANTKLLNLKAIWVGTGYAESLLQVVEMIGVRTRTTNPTSVREEIHFIEQDVVGLLRIVAVHLKCDVDFFLVPIRLSRVVRVDRVGLIGDANSNIMHLIADALQTPCQMDPCVGGE